MSRRVLYHWTQAEVISSRSARVRIGPCRNRGVDAEAFGLVQADRGLGEGVVVGLSG
jgi:hypothetical protein